MFLRPHFSSVRSFHRSGRRARAGARPPRLFFRYLFPAGCLLAGLSLPLRALDEYRYDYRLSRALQRVRMYDFAQRHLEAMLRRYPDKRDAILLEQARTFFLMGKATQGEKYLGRLKSSSPVYGRSRLLLGQMAYRRGDYAAAAAAYAGYFKRHTKPPGNGLQDREEFRRAVHEYAAVLRKKGQGDKAAEVLGYLANVGEGMGTRQLTVLKGQAILAAEDEKVRKGGAIDRAAVERARRQLEALQWQGVDAATAAALVEVAHAYVLLGQYDKAITALSGGSEIFGEVESALRRRRKLAASPVAGAHYYYGRALKGKAFKAFKAGKRDEAKKYLISALKHFYRIAKEYEGSTYSTEGLAEFGKCRNLLQKQFGVKVKLKAGSATAEAAVRKKQADAFYMSKRFSDALPLYLEIVRTGPTVRGFTESAARLAACYGRLDRFLEAEAVADYLADVFPKSEFSARALLQLGALLYKKARAEKNPRRQEALNADAMRVWARFVEIAPTDPKAPEIAFAIAENAYGRAARVAARTVKMKSGPEKEKLKARARELYAQAIPAYRRVIDTFASSAQGVRALYKLGWIYYTLERKKEAAPLFARYADSESDPAHTVDRLEAQFRCAECLMFSEQAEKAVPRLEKLLAWTAPGNDLGIDPGQAKVKDVRERAASYLGWAWDLAAEAFRGRLDKLTAKLQDLREEKGVKVAAVEKALGRRKSAEAEMAAARVAYAEIEKAYFGTGPGAAELAAAAAKAQGKDPAKLTAEEREVAQRDAAALAKRLAAGMASRDRDRLLGEKIQLEKEREEVKRELAAAVEAEAAGAGTVAADIARKRTEYFRARLAALASALRKNAMENKCLQAPPERRPALQAEAVKRTREALAAWKGALEKHLDYLGVLARNAETARKEAEAAIERIDAEIVRIEKELRPLREDFERRKKLAQRQFESFIKAYPTSTFVPDNMARLGTIFVELGQYDRAAEVLGDLAARFPKSEAVQRAFFTLGRSECELGQFKRAAKTFDRVLRDAANQPLANLLYISGKMLEADQPSQALIAGLEIVRRTAEKVESDREFSPAVRENALFRVGRAYFALGKYKNALEFFDKLLAERPKTAYFFQVKLLSGIARARIEPADTAGALQDFGEVLRYAGDRSDLVNQALCESGAVYQKLGTEKDLKLALARYQQIALLADPRVKENRPWIEAALFRSAQCFDRLGRTADVLEMAGRYRKEFPAGAHLQAIKDLADRARTKAGTGAAAKAASSTGG
ncbi:MAG: tetratricopeptide repeat protein [Kiritimatiellaeota bacterium]|nr:tetratricopeptide repeat protein [Kiritimatiellota bacterium]